RSKRFADATSLFQSMGLIAYCKSFKGICEERLRGAVPGLPPFNDEALMISLRARADERLAQAADRATDATVRISRAANWRLFALTVVALATAIVVMFVQPLIEHGDIPKLNALSRALGQHFFTILATGLIFLLFVWALTQSSWQVKHQIGRDILELSNV